MRYLDGGDRIQCRARIEGRYDGEDFIYEDAPDADGWYFYWMEDKNPSTFWWSEGNMSCDCNRHNFLPPHLQEKHNGECGGQIRLKRIIPLEGENLPVVELNEY